MSSGEISTHRKTVGDYRKKHTWLGSIVNLGVELSLAVSLDDAMLAGLH